MTLVLVALLLVRGPFGFPVLSGLVFSFPLAGVGRGFIGLACCVIALACALACVGLVLLRVLGLRGDQAVSQELRRLWKKVSELQAQGPPGVVPDSPAPAAEGAPTRDDPCSPGYTIPLHRPAGGRAREEGGSPSR